MDHAALSKYSRKVWSLLAPKEVVGGTLARIGDDFDGGYVMLDNNLESAVAYSLGIGDEISWDLALANRNAEVFQFDHTIPKFPLNHPRFHSFHIRISDAPGEGENVRTIDELLDEHNHRGRSDMILKIDIEGAEWFVFQMLSSTTLAHFSQILVEFHGMQDMSKISIFNRRLGVLAKLNLTHQVVHVHANNWHDPILIGGIMMPNLIEVTYIRRTDHQFDRCEKIFPTELDQPGSPFKPDIFLGALGLL